VIPDPWAPASGGRVQVLPAPPADPSLAIAALNASVAYLGPQAASSQAVMEVAGKFHAWLQTAVER
jgi:hypothetical protein